jgi:hypothetical protein
MSDNIDEELVAKLAAFDEIYERLLNSSHSVTTTLQGLGLGSEAFQIAIFQAALTIAGLREENATTAW